MEETQTIPFKNLHSREYQGHKKKVSPSPPLSGKLTLSFGLTASRAGAEGTYGSLPAN